MNKNIIDLVKFLKLEKEDGIYILSYHKNPEYCDKLVYELTTFSANRVKLPQDLVVFDDFAFNFASKLYDKYFSSKIDFFYDNKDCDSSLTENSIELFEKHIKLYPFYLENRNVYLKSILEEKPKYEYFDNDIHAVERDNYSLRFSLHAVAKKVEELEKQLENLKEKLYNID